MTPRKYPSKPVNDEFVRRFQFWKMAPEFKVCYTPVSRHERRLFTDGFIAKNCTTNVAFNFLRNVSGDDVPISCRWVSSWWAKAGESRLGYWFLFSQITETLYGFVWYECKEKKIHYVQKKKKQTPSRELSRLLYYSLERCSLWRLNVELVVF